VSPPFSHRVNEIRGPVIVDGGIQVGGEQFLNNPLTLPGETNLPIPDGKLSSTGTVGTLTLTKDDGSAFTTVFTSGTGDVVGVTGATGYRAIVYVTGPVVAGTVWTLSVAGTPFTYAAHEHDTAAAVAAALAALIDAVPGGR